MLIPKIFRPCFTFGVSGVPGVSDSTILMENKGLSSVLADTPSELPRVPGVSDNALIDVAGSLDTPDTPDNSPGVAEKLLDKTLNIKEELDSDTPGTPGTPQNDPAPRSVPETGPIPEGLNAVEACLYRAIAAEPGLSRAQLCERTGITVAAFDASTPVLCGRQLAWSDYTHQGGWIIGRQARAVRS